MLTAQLQRASMVWLKMLLEMRLVAQVVTVVLVNAPMPTLSQMLSVKENCPTAGLLVTAQQRPC